MRTLKNRILVITGSSRGIGRAIALRAARDGARIVIAAKSARPHPKLSGTIHEVAAEVEAAGGEALPFAVDVRDDQAIESMVAATVERFGGIDVLVNNAGAIHQDTLARTPMKRFDLVNAVNARAAFACSRACLPHLERSLAAHILNISPPLPVEPRWFEGRVAYSVSKLGMTMLTIGLAEELRTKKIAVCSLWPRTTIATAAVHWLGGEDWTRRSRRPEIMADAAWEIVTRAPEEVSGRSFLDEDLLRSCGGYDLESYAVEPGTELLSDIFVGGGERENA